MDISVPYYEDLARISNSNIGWFLNKGPAFLHKMLTEPPPEEKNPVLERGTMIHEYLLQPEEFQKDYVVWSKSRPFSAQQEKFCQALASSLELEPNRAILDAYKASYSTAGKSEDKMLSEGLKIASTMKDYIDFLKSDDKRIMITPSEAHMLEKIKKNINAHKIAGKIINSDYGSTEYENWHEFHINWTYYVEMAAGIDCKSLLDGLSLDYKNKKAIIYDLKTTAKLWHFEESIEMYDYLRQLAYYTLATKWYLKNECNEDPEKWSFEYFIVGIDTTGMYDIRVFKIDEKQVQTRNNIIHDALRAIFWHQATDKWEHSREYYEGDGSESLNL